MLEDVQDDSQPDLCVGCDPNEANDILVRAKELGLEVMGLRYDSNNLGESVYRYRPSRDIQTFLWPISAV
jgi:hypothetical protein